MEQNTNLLINVINNITVTNTILISVAIIVASVEVTILLNKGISFLINLWKSKNAPYENDYHVYQSIVDKFNYINEISPARRFESIEFLRNFSSETYIRLLYFDHWCYLDNTEFKKAKYKFKNKNLENKKNKLFKHLKSFNTICKQCLNSNGQLSDVKVDDDSRYTDIKIEKSDIENFCKEAKKLVQVYDEFDITCNDKFNFPVNKKPEKRY
ncbi:MAG: hypothetical protein IJY92_03820 [Alphaproteobacteria bacterium]|nr:hypothetical protein [Alphaproteobacteria bacterium]